ncbi:MAG: ABC transporter ATP-binding protein [archaeon]|nr:ABC transporter ATP-binding protein [Nanoarchaeota archaeon]
MELVKLKEVSKEFGNNLILDRVSLTVEEGDIYAIIGRSGSGKSTILNMMVGFLKPDEGEVAYYTLAGKEVKLKDNYMKIKKIIGFTPQHLSFYPKLTVKENLLHFGRIYNVKDNILIENAKSLLKFTGLLEHRNLLAEELSGGMQKRLDIACSLVHKPKLLVLDEPVTDLDPLLANDILELIKEVNKQGVTVVIASHDLDDIEAICNKIAIINHGEVYQEGLVEEIRRPYLNKGSRISLRTGKNHEKFLEFAKTLPVSRIIDQRNRLILETNNFTQTIVQLAKKIEEEGLGMNHLEISQPSLKTILKDILKEQK